MMRVLFVNPHYTHDPRTLLLHPPLGYAYMATALKAAGHEVRHIDLPFEGNSVSGLGDRLEELKPDLVGVTSVAQSYFHALEVAAAVKAWSERTPVVFGGPHVSFLPRECLDRHSTVDFVLLFDAEQSVVELVAALQASDASALALVPGLAYRQGSGVSVTTPEHPRLDRTRMINQRQNIRRIRAQITNKAK